MRAKNQWRRPCSRLGRALLRNRHGATAIEYGLILALITLACLVSLVPFAGKVVGLWQKTDEKVAGATGQ
ncbi:Flp family type IVb pilin [Sphingomonas sp. ac-8]|uniref:Flp family type IVb pilin n=1 Tax=Sphingomonas sp. ac-8 TaxID=3242977 RepID=UPI003A7FDA68